MRRFLIGAGGRHVTVTAGPLSLTVILEVAEEAEKWILENYSAKDSRK